MRILFIILIFLEAMSAAQHYEEKSSGIVPLRALILKTYPHVNAADKKALHEFARIRLSEGDKPYAQSILNFGAQYLSRTPEADINAPVTLMTQLTGLDTNHIHNITSHFFDIFHGDVQPSAEEAIITALAHHATIEEIQNPSPIPSYYSVEFPLFELSDSESTSEDENDWSEAEGYEVRSLSSEELATVRQMVGYQYPDGHMADGVPCSDDEDYDEYS